MLNQSVLALGQKRSTIRELFEFGNQRAAVVGRENVFDFSIGNPNVPAPDAVKEAIFDILNAEDPAVTHGYTSAQGADFVRQAIADDLNRRFGTAYGPNNLYMTVGAAAALSICFKALTCAPTDEFLVLAPYFPEYLVFIRDGAGATPVVVPPRIADFQIDFDALAARINERTRAVVVNSPNNPSGTVYSEETIRQLAALLTEQSEAYGHPIYIISDEPYRELVYGDETVPFIPQIYPNTLVCYSWSKSLSLPGERIGYIVVPDEVADFGRVYGAIAGAARVLTHVNASSLFQRVVARCVDEPSNIAAYERNGNLLYNGLIEAGFTCQKPQGAFYLFPKALEEDDRAFCKKAMEYDLLLVPGSDFGCPGYFRAAYCIKESTIRNALPVFKKLAAEYK